MKNFFKLGLVASIALVATNTCWADNCIKTGEQLNMTHSLHSTSLDPYSHLLPDLGDVNELATSYDLQLKPLVVNDLTRLQFNTRNTSSPAAGYTSPYLWEAGQGPSYKSRYGNWNGNPMQSQRFSPFPMPIRR